jgi:hypothetical protein
MTPSMQTHCPKKITDMMTVDNKSESHPLNTAEGSSQLILVSLPVIYFFYSSPLLLLLFSPIVHSRFHLPICLLLYFFRLKVRKVRNSSTIKANWDSARSFWVPLQLLRFILSLLFFLSCSWSVSVFLLLIFFRFS